MDKKIEARKLALKKAKGDVLKEFEKVCPTDKSFDRIVKEMHDIFDRLEEDLEV
jgi:ASC-1-like (ASCH) protein